MKKKKKRADGAAVDPVSSHRGRGEGKVRSEGRGGEKIITASL